MSLNRWRNIDVLARTIWGEARGEGRQGMEAVAAVIMNRFHASAWYSAPTVAGVAMKKYQFAAWNQNDPNYNQLINVDKTDPAFAQALEIASQAIAGKLSDITGGATHYYADYIAAPNWTEGGEETAQIGRHKFFKGVA
ncbi:cell wall hydrolase [Paremcibacter congregatus]|uniref:cell wall hydrolase n=1 Tax=Paremcibacter congregatus TaxID=2043170 RepID=UPI003C6DC270